MSVLKKSFEVSDTTLFGLNEIHTMTDTRSPCARQRSLTEAEGDIPVPCRGIGVLDRPRAGAATRFPKLSVSSSRLPPRGRHGRAKQHSPIFYPADVMLDPKSFTITDCGACPLLCGVSLVFGYQTSPSGCACRLREFIRTAVWLAKVDARPLTK